MEPILKRIGDVTIERLSTRDNPKPEPIINSETESEESLLSEDELNINTDDESPKNPNKRKIDEIEIEGATKKSKSEEIKDDDVLSEIKDGEKIVRTRLSDDEDEEYDSEEESDIEMPSELSDGKMESVIDAEKTDFIEKLAGELGESSQKSVSDEKVNASDYDYDITEKLKEMGEISVETVKKGEKPRKPETETSPENEISVTPAKAKIDSDKDEDSGETNSERKIGNLRRNIREVMDETQLDEATLAAQRQEMERLRRVQEQQRIIREVQRQIALNRQNNKTQHRVISLLQGNSSIIKQIPGTSTASGSNRLGGTVLVKLPNGETKPMTRISKGQTPFEVVRMQKSALQGKIPRNLIPVKRGAGGNLTPSVSIAPVAKKIEPKIESDSDLDTSDTEKKVKKIVGKPKGKDVVTISSSSDDDCIVLSEDEPEEPEPEEDPCNSGMHTNDAYNIPDDQGRVLINVGHPENDQDIFLAPQIARVIKPHQIGGVRFLFDNVIESVERFSTSTGFGCILAHSMGLGKTLQIVCFSDIFLRHTTAKTILCIMPINTLQNWLAEYNMWLPKEPISSPLLNNGEVRPRNFNLHVLNDSHKTLAARARVIQQWHKDGGVLLIGYELYRLLSLKRNPKSKSKRKKISEQKEEEDEEKNKSMFDEIHEALVKPGPDLVICDEGHRIKNSHASISQALKQIRSKRRIVLTGYPLQNNLLEYWCMVDFVRPNYLGTKTEFSNMFERPIQNGQCIDSTPQDIRLMRYRAHVLHSLLEGFVQRRSHAVLQTSLPQKEEYVLLVRMTEFQRKLYDTFMNEVVRTKTVPNPLKAFAVCCKIWNHPDVLYYFLNKRNTGEAVDIDLEEVAGATNSNSGSETKVATPKKGSRSKGATKKEKKTAANKNAPNATNNNNNSSTSSSPNSSKPAASITPNNNSLTSTMTIPTDIPNAPLLPNPNMPIPSNLPPNLNLSNPNIPNQNIGNNLPNPNMMNTNMPNPNMPNPNLSNIQNPNIPNPNLPNNNNLVNSNVPNPNMPPNLNQNMPNPPNMSNPNPNMSNPNQNMNLPNPNMQNPSLPNPNMQNPSLTNPNMQNPNLTNPNMQNPNLTNPNIQNPNSNLPNPSLQNPNPNLPNSNIQNTSISTPANPNPTNSNQNYNQQNPNYPNYQNTQQQQQVQPYPNQNYQNYPPNNDYYNQNQYPNQYGNNYYPNQDYANYYGDQKPPEYPNNYQQDGSQQNYWQGQQQQYYNQNGPPNNEYYNNINPPNYPNNQDYYRQNQYNNNTPNYNQNNMYPQNQQYQQQWPNPEVKSEFPKQEYPKSEFPKSEFVVKQEFDNATGSFIASESGKIEEVLDLEKEEKKEEDKKKEEKEEDDEVKEVDIKAATDVAANLTKLNSKEDPGIPYDWAYELLKGYVPGAIENSAKMEIFFCILQESMALGDRILLFSQSLFTLNLIEDFLQVRDVPGSNVKWAKNKNYYRLDGSTSALEREKLINEYNSNPNIHLFLVSTRAGSLGINLVGANRVVVFDASWNPCHDTQAVCRVYRYGQKKPCFVYRIVMDNCLEKKIYDRQINKQGMADRVVDECNPDAHLSMKDVTNLCWDDEQESEVKDFSETKDKYIDVVMQKVLDAFSHRLTKEPFQHESLLIDRKEKKLSQAEKRLAKRSYELEKQANINSRPTYSSYYTGQGPGLQIRAIRTQDGMLQNKPIASVRPMQSEMNPQMLREPGRAPGQRTNRWIPAEVWQRQGMTAQEMTLPLDVVIPTNSPDRGSIVLKAGQKVLVLKSPKGIYMQLECGKIVAIKTAFKVRGGKTPESKVAEESANKEGPPTTILKKIPGPKPGVVPLPLKNNSAITVIPKAGQQKMVKPLTQTMKLNMRSIRQPVPNLITRQVPIRMGGPRFTGKIQSVHRKVQLAKAKPYNLDKPSDLLLKIGDSSSPSKLDETHIVPSSDEEPHPETNSESNFEGKDDTSANEGLSEESSDNRLGEGSKSDGISPEQSQDPFTNPDYGNTSSKYPTTPDIYTERYPNPSTDIKIYPEPMSRYSEQDSYSLEKYPEKFMSPESFPLEKSVYSNQPRYPTVPPVEHYEQPNKFPNQSRPSKVLEAIAPDLSDLLPKDQEVATKTKKKFINPVTSTETAATNRSLKNYRHNFAGQKAGPKSSKTITSSALHQLEQTTSAIGEVKQPFQESLDSITNSYPTVPDNKNDIIDLDGKDDIEIIEKPSPAAANNSKSQQKSQQDSEDKSPESSQPNAINPQQDYAYNYYGYNHMQPYPGQPYYNNPEAPYAMDNSSSKSVDSGKTGQASQSASQTTTAQPQASGQRSDSVAPAEQPPPHYSGTPAPANYGPYGQPSIPPQAPYDMMGYPQQNQYPSSYPAMPYPNQPNYQPYQPPPYDQQAPYGAPNMYSAFHRPDAMHQYPAPPDPYAQPHQYPIRHPYPPQYPYPNPPGQYPPAGYQDYNYSSGAYPPPPPFMAPYPGLPNNNPAP